MGIQGLIPENIGSGLPRIGKFHKGTPKIQKVGKDGKRYETVGTDTDYFRVSFNEGYEVYQRDFEAIYGKQPRSLLVKFNASTVSEVFDFWREEWDAAETLLHRCDGKEQAITYNRSTGYFEQNQHLCAAPRCGCVPVARLEVILPEFFEATGVLGTFTLETHSEQDIRVLYARLTSFQVLLGGSFKGIPLYLYREKRETGAPEVKMVDGDNGKKQAQRTGKRLKVTRAMIDINIAPDFIKTNLSPALIGTAFSTISPAFEAPKEHPVLVAAVHRGDAARLALGSGQKRLGQNMPETPAQEAVEKAAPAKSKPDWWTRVMKTFDAGRTDEERDELRKNVKALVADGTLGWELSQSEAYDAIVSLIIKPELDKALEAESDELSADADAHVFATKEEASE